MLEKEKLRNKYKEIRASITNKDIKSDIIFRKIIESDVYKNANIVAIYKSMPDEVETSKIIDKALKDGKTVVLPRVVNKTDLEFYKISTDEKFETSKFGVEEPFENKESLVGKKDIDLIIIPGVCFDKNGNRIGYGKGYYDRYLQNIPAIKMGICFPEQITYENIEVESTDIKMDLIIT